MSVKRQNAHNRVFRGMPVRDGKSNIRVQPNKQDIKKAVPGDPTHCAYAECLRRQYDASNVWVFKTVAYVQLLDESGKPIVERYAIHEEARWYLDRFDNGEKIHPAGFVLQAPTESDRLDHITEYKRQIAAERKARGEKVKKYPQRAAKIIGSRKTGAAIVPRELNGFTRSGAGMVHFRAKATTIKARTEDV
jgi:hypothetical protein